MRNKIVTTIVFLAAMIAMTGAGAAAVLTYELTHSNEANLNNNVDAKVIIDDAAKTISVQLISSPSGLQPLGIDQFFYNISDNVQSVNDANWNVNTANAEADGFGKFLSLKSQDPAGTGGISSPLVFTLKDPFSIPIVPNNHGGTIAIHVRFGTCSGWISDGTVLPGSIQTTCSATQIPEFPTIAVPVAAAIGLLFLFQHKKKK